MLGLVSSSYVMRNSMRIIQLVLAVGVVHFLWYCTTHFSVIRDSSVVPSAVREMIKTPASAKTAIGGITHPDDRDWAKILRGVKYLKRNDVVLMLKPGIMVADRMQAQIDCFLDGNSYWSHENAYCASDANYKLGNFSCYDVLADILDADVRNSDGFQTYNEQIHALDKPDFDMLRADRFNVGDRGVAGWKLDAYKYLPGAIRTYKQFPDAKWYVFIDDDTFIHTRNLLLYLEMFDPDKDIWTGGWFPNSVIHGGGGMVFSNSVMRKRFGSPEVGGFGDDEHIVPWIRHTLGRVVGDGTTSDSIIMSEEVGIKPLTTESHFFGSGTPDEAFIHSDRACIPVVSWHHLGAAQMAHYARTVGPDNNDDETDTGVDTCVDMLIRFWAEQLRRAGHDQPSFTKDKHHPKVTRRNKDIAVLRRYGTMQSHWAYFSFDTWDSRERMHYIDIDKARSPWECQKICDNNVGKCVAWLWIELESDPTRVRCANSQAVWGYNEGSASGYRGLKMIAGLNVDTLLAWQSECEDDRWRNHLYSRPELLRKEYRTEALAKIAAGDPFTVDAWPRGALQPQ